MDHKRADKDESSDSAREDAPVLHKTHSESGAPTDEAHREAGDGSLTGSIPAGLTSDELRKSAEEDKNVEPGTG